MYLTSRIFATITSSQDCSLEDRKIIGSKIYTILENCTKYYSFKKLNFEMSGEELLSVQCTGMAKFHASIESTRSVASFGGYRTKCHH